MKTVLASGNLVFDARAAADASLERKAEASMQGVLGRSFYTIVRPVDTLRACWRPTPTPGSALPANAKRVVSFVREPMTKSWRFRSKPTVRAS